jgi:hypothetical protein
MVQPPANAFKVNKAEDTAKLGKIKLNLEKTKITKDQIIKKK